MRWKRIINEGWKRPAVCVLTHHSIVGECLKIDGECLESVGECLKIDGECLESVGECLDIDSHMTRSGGGEAKESRSRSKVYWLSNTPQRRYRTQLLGQ